MAIESNHSAIRRMRMRGDHFTQVSNDLARDRRLSRRARGLFVELASHKEGWQTSIAKLAENGPEGIHAIRVAISELEKYGYLVRVQVRDPKTRQVVGTEYWITDCPEEHIPSSEPLSGKCTTAPENEPPSSEPLSEKPSSAPPSSAELISAELTSEDRTPYKKTIPQNTKEKKTNPSPLPPVDTTPPKPKSPHRNGEEEDLQNDHQAQADRLVQSLPWPRQPTVTQRNRLTKLVAACLARGWTVETLQPELVTNLGGAQSVYAIWTARLRDLPEPPAGPAPGPRTLPPRCDDPRHDPAMPADRHLYDEERRPSICSRCHPRALRGVPA